MCLKLHILVALLRNSKATRTTTTTTTTPAPAYISPEDIGAGDCVGVEAVGEEVGVAEGGGEGVDVEVVSGED